MSHSTKNFLELFSHLFLIDPSRLFNHNKQQVDYEAEERGYSYGILKGYQYAFTANFEKTMSHATIKAIHKCVMEHDVNSMPGQYKTSVNNFQIYTLPFNDKQNCTYSASIEGFLEFVQTSLLTVDSVHGVNFSCPKNDLYKTARMSFSLQSLDGQLKTYSGYQDFIEAGVAHLVAGEVFPKPYLYNPALDNPRIEYALQRSSAGCVLEEIRESDEPYYICAINSMSEDLIPHAKFHNTLLSKLDTIFNRYYAAIDKCNSDDEKLEVIVTWVQKIAQLHPFSDGNIRVSYILLNRLLKEEKLKLTLLFNPNRFDCFSVRELIAFIKQGQTFCAEFLLQERLPNFEQDPIYASALNAGLKKYEVTTTRMQSHAAFNQALDNFISLLQLEQQWLSFKTNVIESSRLTGNRYRFMSSPVETSYNQSIRVDSGDLLKMASDYIQRKPKNKQKSYQSLSNAIKEGQFEVALRKAASVNEIYIVLLILNHVNEKNITFNINAQSPTTHQTALELSDISSNNSLDKDQTRYALLSSGAQSKDCLTEGEEYNKISAPRSPR